MTAKYEENGVTYGTVAVGSGAKAFDMTMAIVHAYHLIGVKCAHVTLRSVDGKSLERLRNDEVRHAPVVITSDSNGADTEAFQVLREWAERNGVRAVFSILVCEDDDGWVLRAPGQR